MEKKFENMYIEFTTAPDIAESDFLKGTLFLNAVKREGEFAMAHNKSIIFDIKAVDIYKADGHFQVKLTESDETVWWFQEAGTD